MSSLCHIAQVLLFGNQTEHADKQHEQEGHDKDGNRHIHIPFRPFVRNSFMRTSSNSPPSEVKHLPDDGYIDKHEATEERHGEFPHLARDGVCLRPQKLSLVVRKLHRKLRPVHGVVVPVNREISPRVTSDSMVEPTRDSSRVSATS